VFNIGLWELGVLLLIGVILLGPDKLPGYARDAARLLKRARALADDATRDLREEMGPEYATLDPRQLHPKALIQRHVIDPVFADDEEAAEAALATPARPLPPSSTDASAPTPWDDEAT
jgi:sec-independent protein translocase protein TatB